MSKSIYPFDSKHNFSFDAINEISQEVKQIPTMEIAASTTVSTGTSIGTKIIIVAAVIVTLASIGVGVGLGLSKFNNNNNNKNDSDIQPSPTPSFTCEDNPSQCQGVPASVSNYIMSSYTNAEEIRSLLQLSRTVSEIPVNASRDNLTTAFRSLSSSIECMAYTMPGTYASAYQDLISLQFNNEAAVQSYLSMNEAFSGQPVSLTPTADLAANCQFNISARRRLQSSSSCTNQTNLLIYVSGPGSSPSRTINELQQIQSLVANTTSTLFDSVLSISPSRTDGNTNFYRDTLSRILSNSTGASRFAQSNSSRLDILQSLRLMVDNAATTARIPSTISRSQYNQLTLEFMQTYLSSLHNNISNYGIQQHVNFVTNHINEGKRVVVVSHGENTEYANQLYNGVGSSLRSSVSLVYVAPTVSSIPGTGNNASYITNPSDQAANRVQQEASAGRAQTPLPANVGNSTFNRNNTLRSGNSLGSEEYNDDTEMNHDFRGYLNFYRSEILNLIQSARGRAVQPTRTMGNGLITAALNWDSQPDLDLHIFQPNFHIYYVQRQGTNGYLDVDKTNGYGPEHYYTGCSLETGNYTFKVNYYSGSAPSTATLSVSAGSEFYTKTFVLDHSVGSGGNSNPAYEICTVTVTRSPYSNNYLFSISHP